MKLSAVYKSAKKADTYLYLKKQNDFGSVPEQLMSIFGAPKFVCMVPLEKRSKIANIDKDSFVSKLVQDGYYLQMPPKEKSLLELHRESLGLDSSK